MLHPADNYTILQTDIVVTDLYRHLMRSHMIILRENREYLPGERDLDVWLWLTGLSAGALGLFQAQLGAQYAPVPRSNYPFNPRVSSMSTMSAQLRDFKEPGDEQPLLFYRDTRPVTLKAMVSVETTPKMVSICCAEPGRGHTQKTRTSVLHNLDHSIA